MILSQAAIKEWADRIEDECYIWDSYSNFDVDKCYDLLCELVAKVEAKDE